MNSIIKQNQYLKIFGIPFLLFVSIVLLIKSNFLTQNENLELAISIDLLLTVPFVYYLLIRKTNIIKTTVVPVMLIGLLIGTVVLPKENQGFLDVFKLLVVPVIELSVLIFIVFKVIAFRIKFKNSVNADIDFFTAIKSISVELFPGKLAILFATEITVFYYCFFTWKKKILRPNEYSYHKNGGGRAVLGALMMVVLIETSVFHLLLSNWSQTAAWIFSGLSIYTGFQIFGVLKSIPRRPIELNQESIILRYGLLSEVEIELDQISSVTYSNKLLSEREKIRIISPLSDFESHNVILELNKPVKIEGLYGFTKTCDSLAFQIDDLERFKAEFDLKKLVK